jgi:ABC-type polysaccharide/polyol phosphate export permease
MTAQPTSKYAKAWRDLSDGAASVHIWLMLAWQEVRQRYRRSVLGPFWLTISMGALIGAMGPLYGKLFGQEMTSYFPYLAIGFVVWALIASLINEGCNAFIASEGLIKQTRMPLSVHAMRVVCRNLIVSAHHFLIVIVVLAFFPPKLLSGLVLVPLGILAIAFNGIWTGMLLGLLCARFRDIPLIVQSLVQVAFFLTPVLWHPGSLGRFGWFAEWNPFYHFIEIVRAPLMGLPTPVVSWLAVLFVSASGSAVAFAFFVRYRARIAYWV